MYGTIIGLIKEGVSNVLPDTRIEVGTTLEELLQRCDGSNQLVFIIPQSISATSLSYISSLEYRISLMFLERDSGDWDSKRSNETLIRLEPFVYSVINYVKLEDRLNEGGTISITPVIRDSSNVLTGWLVDVAFLTNYIPPCCE